MSEITQNNKTSFYWPKLNQKRHSYVNWQWKSHDIRIFCNTFDNPFKRITAKYNRSKILLHSAKLVDKNINFHPFQYGMIYRKNKKRILLLHALVEFHLNYII